MTLKLLCAQILNLIPLTVHSHVLQASRGLTFIHQEVPQPDVFILTKGLVKLSYLTPDGREHIKSFLLDEGLLGPRAPLSQSNASFSATCLSDCRIVRISGHSFEKALSESAQLSGQMMRVLNLVAQKKEARERDLLCLSATERYQQLLKEQPTLCARLAQADIAGYLGITPVALSRIRGRLRMV